MSSQIVSAQSYKKIPGDTTLEKALLWQISGADLLQPSYLFGTSHLLCTYHIDTPFVLINAINSCKTLVLEITDSTSAHSAYTTPIKDLVGKWYYKGIRQAITTVYPAEADTSEKYRLPPRAYIDLILGASLSCPMTSFESQLLSFAKRNNIPVRGLETNKDRDSLGFIAKLSLKQQGWRLEEFMDNQENNIRSFAKFIAFYKDHDITNLYVISTYLFSFRGFPVKGELSNTLLNKRNALWLPRMETMMKEEASFFAVGCAHLAGGYGLISLLRQRGYTLTPVF